mmetsp:Transcript_6587/g.17064  ORF Transcript_6587/g.17064 Transcript_6587/m.17064 type:complete len:200 (-) Transcript_6587:979-1578(-)
MPCVRRHHRHRRRPCCPSQDHHRLRQHPSRRRSGMFDVYVLLPRRVQRLLPTPRHGRQRQQHHPLRQPREGGHRKRRDGFNPLLQIPATAEPTWTVLLRRFVVIYGDAAFRASPSAKRTGRFWALPGDGGATPPLTWNAATLGDWLKRLKRAVGRINRAPPPRRLRVDFAILTEGRSVGRKRSRWTKSVTGADVPAILR